MYMNLGSRAGRRRGAGGGEVGAGGGIGENLLINGAFQINQRSFAGGALSAGAYGHDRWKAGTGGANYSVSGFTVTLASGSLQQVIEPALWGLESFASLPITISVENPSADLEVSFGSQIGVIFQGSGRQSVTITLGPGDTGNLTFSIASDAGGSVTFGRVKLEIGNVATGWWPRSAEDELHLCWRYYQFSNGTFPLFIGARSSFNATGFTNIMFPVTMRATPTVTPGAVINGDPAGTLMGNLNNKGFTLFALATSGSRCDLVGWKADAEL